MGKRRAGKKVVLGREEVEHVAKLANLKLTPLQIKRFTSQLSSVVDYVSKIQKLNTKRVRETSQVTSLENVFREDEVETERVLSQDEALKNAKRTSRGYFVVDAIFD